MRRLLWVGVVGLMGCTTPTPPAIAIAPAPIPSELVVACKKVPPPRSLADDILNNPQQAIQRLLDTLTTQYEALDECQARTEELKQWDQKRINL